MVIKKLNVIQRAKDEGLLTRDEFMNLTYSQLLRGNRDFRNLFWGQLVSELGNWFNFIAVLGLIRFVSGASAEAAGIFIVCRTLPFSLLMPFAGTFADRFSRRRIMIATDLIRFFVAFSFLLITSSEDLWIAYVGTILLSTGAAFFEAGKNAATPNISGTDGLFAGTALMFSSRWQSARRSAARRRLFSAIRWRLSLTLCPFWFRLIRSG
jgi:MFS family permease